MGCIAVFASTSWKEWYSSYNLHSTPFHTSHIMSRSDVLFLLWNTQN